MSDWIAEAKALGKTDQEIVDAMVRANDDRRRAAALRRVGALARRDDQWSVRHRSFIQGIEALAFPERQRGMDTIRPNKKKQQKRGKKR